MSDDPIDNYDFGNLFGTTSPAPATAAASAPTTAGDAGTFNSVLSSITGLASSGLSAYSSLLGSQNQQTAANSAAQTAATNAQASALAKLNWSKYLPWAIGAAVVAGIAIWLFKRR